MPNDLAAMGLAWLAVSVAAALPLVALHRLRKPAEPLWPRWKPVPFRGTILDWLMLYCAYLVILSAVLLLTDAAGLLDRLYGRSLPALTQSAASAEASLGSVAGAAVGSLRGKAVQDASQLRQMWAALCTLPLLLAFAALLRQVVHGVAWRAPTLPRSRDIALGAAVATPLTPLVFAVYALTTLLHDGLGGAKVEHPLARLGAGDSLAAQAFFFVSVCVVAPWAEELLFRGTLLRWASTRPGNGLTLFVVAAALAAFPGFAWDPRPSPVVFLAALYLLYASVVYGLPRVRPRFPTHTFGGIVSTAALFAAAHSAVWPTPVPLFALGCGLGYLTARTGNITASVVTHGLFNAVSTVFLIRQAAA